MRISRREIQKAEFLKTGSDGSDHTGGLVNTDLMNTQKLLDSVQVTRNIYQKSETFTKHDNAFGHITRQSKFQRIYFTWNFISDHN